MQKVLFVVESLSGGGAEKVLSTIVANINQTKFDITVLTIVKTGVYVEEVEKNCKLISVLPNYANLKTPIEKLMYKLKYHYIYHANIHNVYKHIIREKYDIEVAFVEGFDTKLIAASNNPNSKKICWVHTDIIENNSADSCYTNNHEHEKAYKKYDKIVAVSKPSQWALEKKFAINESIKIIYNPVDVNYVKKQAVEYSLPQPYNDFDGLKIVLVGRLVEQKGFDRFINALSKVEKTNISYQVYIVGEGSQRELLNELIQKYNLQQNVFLVGFQKNPYVWMQNSDVLLCSSRAEGYSLVVAEAMVLGKPILSTDCSGPNELLDFGKFGYLFENSESGLEKTLFKLFHGEIDLEKYSSLSIERSSFFNIESAVNNIERLFSYE